MALKSRLKYLDSSQPIYLQEIVRIAEKLQKDPAQIILSWRGRSLTVIVNCSTTWERCQKSSKESRIKSNFDLFELDKGEFDAIENISRQSGQKDSAAWIRFGTQLFSPTKDFNRLDHRILE